jgi:hypothetical protein
MPIKLSPWFWFTNISDGSVKYGGDSISEYKLTATCEYEIWLPTYMVLKPYACLERIYMDVRMDSAYSRYGLAPTFDIMQQKYTPSQDQESDVPANRIQGYSDNLPLESSSMAERTYYKFTAEDEATNPEWFELNNPFNSDVPRELIYVVTYRGYMDYGDDAGWKFNDDKSKILIKIEAKENELIELFRYE